MDFTVNHFIRLKFNAVKGVIEEIMVKILKDKMSSYFLKIYEPIKLIKDFII